MKISLFIERIQSTTVISCAGIQAEDYKNVLNTLLRTRNMQDVSKAVAAPRGARGQVPPLENALPPHLPPQNFPD